MSYWIRTKSGELKVRIDNNTAQDLMQRVKGFFRQTRYKDKPQKTVFEVSDEVLYGISYGPQELSTYLWCGDTLEPAD